MKNLESITFDKDDKTLFAISDLQLKADAIRYSILPKLEVIANELAVNSCDVDPLFLHVDPPGREAIIVRA